MKKSNIGFEIACFRYGFFDGDINRFSNIIKFINDYYKEFNFNSIQIHTRVCFYGGIFYHINGYKDVTLEEEKDIENRVKNKSKNFRSDLESFLKIGYTLRCTKKSL